MIDLARRSASELAELNLLAGQRAKASTAYASALNYLAAGAALLPEDTWERLHELSFALELRRAECEFLTGALAEAEQRLAALSTRAGTTVERATVACLRVDLYMTIDQSSTAPSPSVSTSSATSASTGRRIRLKSEARDEYERIWSQLGDRTIEELRRTAFDERPRHHSRPLSSDASSAGPALYTDAQLFSLASCRAVNLSLEHGNSDASCLAYECFAMAAGPHFRRLRRRISIWPASAMNSLKSAG